jgi:tryptophanyl-tRNA synthetase
MKKQLAEDIVKFTSPLKEKIDTIVQDDAYLSRVVKMGEEKARASASKTVKEVREIIGFKKF